MHASSNLIAAIALLAAAPTVVLGGGPGQPSKIPDVSDGPDKVTLCTPCDPITAVMLKCQRSNNNDVRKCACIPNSEAGAWYGYIHNCRACLSDNSAEDFFDSMSSTLSQLMVSCTNAGGSVTSDGQSICAGNAMFESCTALRDNSTSSWATYESFKEKTGPANSTFVLNLNDPFKPAQKVVSSTTVAPSTSATGTGSGSAQATGSSGSSGQGGNGTNSASSQDGTAESSAVGSHQVGSLMGAFVAVAFGVLMF
ncbi:hypothetical protein QBC43DRAFT_306857 [Cladorrhinum sp. PSN259]|nr:hypothetical protein QBC43DRAFT_306857 [Cladorrhinum sp. PSN259]